uniref:Uncharacterized protein n=1 Tax=Anguilla anguilla TaxID=7936 RepID=A0A0E9SDG0_ANGAN
MVSNKETKNTHKQTYKQRKLWEWFRSVSPPSLLEDILTFLGSETKYLI